MHKYALKREGTLGLFSARKTKWNFAHLMWAPGELPDGAGGGICGGLDLHHPGGYWHPPAPHPPRAQVHHARHLSGCVTYPCAPPHILKCAPAVIPCRSYSSFDDGGTPCNTDAARMTHAQMAIYRSPASQQLCACDALFYERLWCRGMAHPQNRPATFKSRVALFYGGCMS